MKKLSLLLVMVPLLTACDSLPSWMGGAPKEVVRLPGKREDVLLTDQSNAVDEKLKTTPLKIPPAAANANWAQPTDEFTAANGNLALTGDLTQDNATSIGDGNKFSHMLIPKPVIADGKLFAMDGAGYVSAHALGDIGKKIWTSKSLVNAGEDEVMGGGLAASGGKLYAVCGLGQVAAMDSENGNEIWKRDLGIPLRSAPRVVGNMLYVISIESQLFALDVATGKTLWTHRGISEGAGLMNAVSPAVTSNMLFAPYASGELYSLKLEDGSEIWRASLAQTRRTSATSVFSGIGGDPVVDGQVVFAVSSGGVFSVYNILNGQPLWDKQISSLNTPWLAGDYIFVLSEDNVLMALLKYDGRVRWSTQLSRFEDEKRHLKPIIWHGPVLANDKLIVVSSNGEMNLIEASTGDIAKTYHIDSDINTAPVIAGGKLYLVGRDARLHEFQ